MDMDRPHFRTTSTGSSTTTATAATSELFICFTSRLSSSSSMKLTKSILSPGRAARDGGPASLSSSLSRRLRTNGSLKGGQASPFLTTTTGKKRGCAFENPEPSSPKVTCIGQVRVKTKKKVKQTRSLSRRRSGEVSFRKIEQGRSCGDEDNKVCSQQQQQECLPHRNQRWVHLPVSICEALRAFGAEFSCLFPCKSSCFSTGEREKGEKQRGSAGNENGCGAVFARWLVSVNDGEGGKRREIELVVGGGDEEVDERAERMSMRSSRRHVFEDIEVKDDRIEVKGQSLEGEEEAARVSICIPPKNALLLMRCRSDPMKMADLAHRFSWDARAAAPENNDDKVGIEEVENEQEENVEEQVLEVGKCEIEEDGGVLAEESIEENDIPKEEGAAVIAMEVGSKKQHGLEVEKTQAAEELVISGEEIVEEELQQESVGDEHKPLQEEEEEEEEEKEEVESNMSSFEALLDQENVQEPYQDYDEQAQQHDTPICHSPQSTLSEEEIESNQAALPLLEEEGEGDAIEKENEETQENQTTTAEGEEEEEDDDKDSSSTSVNNDAEHQLNPQPETAGTVAGEEGEQSAMRSAVEPELHKIENPEHTTNAQVIKKEKGNPVLPECLLLMMCEPKLSMEVSKETWVCSTDFIRWLPERPRKSAKGPPKDHESAKRMLGIDSKAKPNSSAQAPPRSSCSSMTTMIEQKLVNAVGYEPFVLTRCKSEPMRTAAAKLMPMPESCCWKNSMRKLEPHRRAALGVGAAGVGF